MVNHPVRVRRLLFFAQLGPLLNFCPNTSGCYQLNQQNDGRLLSVIQNKKKIDNTGTTAYAQAASLDADHHMRRRVENNTLSPPRCNS